MKKALSFFTTIVLSLSLVACGSTGSSGNSSDAVNGENTVEAGSNKSASGESDTDVYVDIWGVWGQDDVRSQFFQEKADEYAKQYEEETGNSLKIEYVTQGGYDGVAEKLTAGSVSQELPVIGQIEESFLQQFYPIATDLSGYMDKEVIDNYLDGLMVSAYHDDTLYAVPGGRSYAVLYANKKLVEEAGHTVDEIKTWDDLREVAKDIAALGEEKEGYGINWDSDAWHWESAVYSDGGNITNEDGTKVTFADNGVGAIHLQLMQDMMKEGSAYSAYGQSTDAFTVYTQMFLEGNLGMFCSSCTSYESLRSMMEEEGYTNVEVCVLDQPAGEAGNSVVTGGSNFIVCNKATEAQKKAAAGFLEYLASDENQAKWNEVSGYLAVTESVYDSEYFEENRKDSNLVQIAEGVKYAHQRPQTKHWREMYTYIVDCLQNFSINPDNYNCTEMVDEMAEYCQKIIDNGAQ